MKSISKSHIASLTVGFLFAIGLGISGMTQPSKIFGFLDIFGSWDPSLIFVMVGSIGLHFLVFRAIKKDRPPLFEQNWHIPTRTEITPSLIVGSSIFGVGWALAGYCPGPAIVSLASLQLRPWIFVMGMLLGMWIFKVINRKFKFKR